MQFARERGRDNERGGGAEGVGGGWEKEREELGGKDDGREGVWGWEGSRRWVGGKEGGRQGGRGGREKIECEGDLKESSR